MTSVMLFTNHTHLYLLNGIYYYRGGIVRMSNKLQNIVFALEVKGILIQHWVHDT